MASAILHIAGLRLMHVRGATSVVISWPVATAASASTPTRWAIKDFAALDNAVHLSKLGLR